MKIKSYLYIVLSFLSFVNSYSLPKYKLHSNRQLDKKIWKITKPATINYIMVPVVGMVDTLWVSKLGTSSDLAGAGSGDQIFSIFYSLMSFLPILVTPEISKLHTQKNNIELSNIVNTSLIMSIILGSLGSLLYFNTEFITKLFVQSDTQIYFKAIQYLKIRSIAMPFCLLNSVIFSILRGLVDINSAIKINVLSQVINLILDPILMINYGLKGVAASSVLSEIVCSIGYINIILKKQLIKSKTKKFLQNSKKFIRLGFFLQLKFFLVNLLYIVFNRKILSFDSTGNQLAAHIIVCKFLSITMILYRGLSSASSVIISSEKIYNTDKGAKNRILLWTHFLAIIQSIIFLNLRFFINYFTNEPEVIKVFKNLILITTVYQYSDGYHQVLEGILQGYQKFKISSIVSLITLIPLLFIVIKSNNIYNLWNIVTITLLFQIKIIQLLSK